MTDSRPTWPRTAQELAERFDRGTPHLVGIEEEVMLLDPENLSLAHIAPNALALANGDARFKLELPASQLEIITPPQPTVRAAAESLLCARRALAAATDGTARLAAAGAHPFSPGVGELNTGDRYRRIAEGYGCIARRELVCALQVHVSVGDQRRALAVYNAARSYLPQLAALAANAPFYEGADTGLASVRPKLAMLLPRQGVPPAIADWAELSRMLSWQPATDALDAPGTWWWELRLHGGVGTLEFRVPDAQATVAEAAAIVALVQALVAWLGQRHDDGEELSVHRGWMIEENSWSACRYGVSGKMTDLERGTRMHTRALLEDLVQQLEPTAAGLGSTPELSAIASMLEANGAILQRRAAERGGPRAAAGFLAERFLEPIDG